MLEKMEEISPTSRRLIINVPSEIIQSETASAYNELRTTTKIPGFRPGKAPQAILEKKFAKDVEARIIERIVPQYYMEAIKEANIEPVSYPSLDEQLELKSGQPLTFTVTVEIKPELGDINYEGIVLKEKTFTVEDNEIDKAISFFQESKALYAVTEEGLQKDDMVIMDCEAFIDGEAREELSYKEFPLLIGSEGMPKEFGEALIGKKKGENAEIKIKFEEDNPNATVAGKEVLFKVALKETKKKHVPPVDDELAKEAECENVEDFRNKVRENIGKKKESQVNLEYKKDILNELTKRHDIAIPDSMFKGEIESLVHQAKQNAERRGETVKPDEELAAEFEGTARDNVRSVILLEAIGKKEKIEVTDDDVEKAVDEIASRNNLKREEVMKLYAVREGSMDALKSRLFADKVLDFILEKSTIEKNGE